MEQHGISKLDLKRQNRMQVLKILKQRGPTSRIDIAGTLELTRAAVTIITNEMIEQGIIAEIGEYKHVSEKAPRGRKKILIDINHNYKFVLGITIEEHIVSVGLSTLAGEVLDKRNMDISDTTTAEQIISFSETSAREILSYNCLDRERILGIGIGIIPSMYSRLGIPVTNKIPDYSVISDICRKSTSLPVVIDNSVKGTAMANIDFQKVKDPNRHNIAFLQYGNSFNFVVTNLNDPIVSYDNRTDFVDKIIINPYSTQTCECGRRGCAKSELAPACIIEKAVKVYSETETPTLYRLTDGSKAEITLANLRQAYLNGDAKIVEILGTSTALMAVLLNNLFFSTNPQKLVLHDFELSDSAYMILREKVAEIGGEEVASKIDLSIIEPKHKFLSGCALAIRELFFTRGGFDN